MPSLQKIEEFKKTLRALGQEPQVLAERGESFPDVRPPEGISSDDLNDLLGITIPSEEEENPPEADIRGEAGGEPALFEEPLLEDDLFSVPEGLFAEPEAPEQGEDSDEFAFPEDIVFDPGDSDPGELDDPPSPEELFSSDFITSFDTELGRGAEDPDGLEADSLPGAEDELSLSFSDEPDSTEDDPFENSPEEMPDLESFTLPDDFNRRPARRGGGPALRSSASPARQVTGADADGDELGDSLSDLDQAEPEEDFSPDEFDLGDLGKDFGLEDSAESDRQDPRPGTQSSSTSGFDRFEPAGSPSDDEPAAEIHIAENDFEAIRRTLTRLPRNLKIIVEELIGEGALSGEPLRRLLDMLIRGDSVRAIAGFAGKLSGSTIPIPRGYEKKSGIEFEREQSSLSYAFKRTILPLFRIVAISLSLIFLVFFLGHRFVYRPLYAQLLYSRGYAHLTENRFQPADEQFGRAAKLWRFKSWFFRYAAGFAERKAYPLAAKKYEELLESFPGDRKGILAYAGLRKTTGEYPKVRDLLETLLDKDMYDYQALLLLGDSFLAWAEEEPGRYEDARASYALLIQRYGQKDELMFRMLRYFIRVDRLEEVLTLTDSFLSYRKLTVDAEVFAELGGYLIDRGLTEDVHEILRRALAVKENLPEIHYNLGRYFRKIEDEGEEEKALRYALDLFAATSPLSRRELAMHIDTLTLMGEAFYRRGEYLSAERSYAEGIGLYEVSASRGLLARSPYLGRMYAGLGDIHYYVSGELQRAEDLFVKAESDGYARPELFFKKGFIAYMQERYDRALVEFHKAAEGHFSNRNLLYATGNAFFRRGDYFAAQGYYAHLLEQLERERKAIPMLRLAEDPRHRSLVTLLMKIYNNLGVTLHELSKRTGDVGKSSQAMVYLTYSSEYHDGLSRNPQTMERSATKNLAFLNTRSLLYPIAGYDAQIYSELPRDFSEPDF